MKGRRLSAWSLVALMALVLLAGCIQDSDQDADGLSDKQEDLDGTDPRAADTDWDGLSDKAEKEVGTNATAIDSDEDGATDKSEVENKTDPLDPEQTVYVLPPPPHVDAKLLLRDLHEFATGYPQREGNLATHKGARDWLAQELEDAGLEVWRQDFSSGGLDQVNIVGIKWGLDRQQWVVVGGHYDTTHFTPEIGTRTQGAYDDGSGTMMSLHLAKAYANLTMPYTMAFVAFDGEERGLEGSRAFVEAMSAGEVFDATIIGALNIDMFGLNWPGVEAPIQFVANQLDVRTLADGMRRQLGVPDDMFDQSSGLLLGSSDYQSFFNAGIPTGFLLSDFDKLGAPLGLPATTPQGTYPFWHLQDTMQTMTLMAGDAAHLEQGFQTGVELANLFIHAMAAGPMAAPQP